MNTPGIYIRETLSQPAVVGAISTALPAFIGYTEKTAPALTPINNMLDFETHFGGGYEPDFTVTLNAQNEIQELVPDYRFFLRETVELYFINGGGPCHIISAGTYTTVGNAQTQMETAFAELQNLEKVTLVVVPDLHAEYKDGNQDLAPLVSPASYAYLTSSLINELGNLKNKVAIFDLHRPSSNPNADAIDFRGAVTPTLGEDLKYGVAYYPWLKNVTEPSIGVHQLSLSASFAGDPLVDQLSTITTDLAAFDTAVGFSASMEGLKEQYATLKDNFLVATGTGRRTEFTKLFNYFYDLVAVLSQMDGAATSVQSELTTLKNDAVLMQNILHLYRFTGIVDAHPAPNYLNGTGFTVPSSQDWFNLPGATTPYTTLQAIGTDASLLPAYNTQVNGTGNTYTGWASATTILNDLESGVYFNMDLLFAAVARVNSALHFKQEQAEKQLLSEHPVYSKVVAAALAYLQQIPSQGAVLGAYCVNDRRSGVWSSPANQTLQGVSGPLLAVSNAQQDGLNVDAGSGKSINALRTFTGKGTVIWGARTLAGNSPEWRYVSVRRFFIYAQDAIKRSAEAFLFAPNNARTHVQVKGMITSFLVEQWNNGALQGTTLEEAFGVTVEEGPTPGEMDVRVEIAVTRPSEFITIRFTQSMQTV